MNYYHFLKFECYLLDSGQVIICDKCKLIFRHKYYLHKHCNFNCLYYNKKICEKCLIIKINLEEKKKEKKKIIPPEELLIEKKN